MGIVLTSFADGAPCQIVENGKPAKARFSGKSWEITPDGLVGEGTGNFLHATHDLAAGDFRIKARVALARIDGSAASFEINGSRLGFDGRSHTLFSEGPLFEGTKGAVRGTVIPGIPFDLEVIRETGTTRFLIGGQEVQRKEQWDGPVERIGFRPWRNRMTLASFTIEGNLIEPPQLPAPLFQSGQDGYHTYRIPAHGPNQGRLVIPCDHIEAETKHYYSHIIFSDDHGASWKLGGTTPQDLVNECEVVELAGAKLMLNMRNYERTQRTRQTAASDDGGLTWHDQGHDPALIEPICQAAIERYRWPQGEQPGVVLFSNPASTNGRVRMTLRASFDEAKTWSHAAVLFGGPSGYSDLAVLSNGQIGSLYEGGRENLAESIIFTTVPLDALREEKSKAVR